MFGKELGTEIRNHKLYTTVYYGNVQMQHRYGHIIRFIGGILVVVVAATPSGSTLAITLSTEGCFTS